MDPLTQGLLGAVVPQSVAKKSSLRTATIVGLISGMAADLDVLIRSASDPLLWLEFHRHFTHSLFFAPLGAAICALVLFPFFRRQHKLSQIYLWSLLGYSTHGLLDACTSYGTSLYWPFADTRVSWSIMPIIDPIFTPILLIAVLAAFFARATRPALLGLLFVACYFTLGHIQKHKALDVQQQLATSRGHTTVRAIVKPSIGNQVLWRSLYEFDNRYYIDAIRVGFFSSPQIFTGEALRKLNTSEMLPWVNHQSVTALDIERFRHFSQDFIALDKQDRNLIIDARYGLLPHTTDPLWGIRLNQDTPDQHVSFVHFRRNLPEYRKQFLDMVLGR